MSLLLATPRNLALYGNRRPITQVGPLPLPIWIQFLMVVLTVIEPVVEAVSPTLNFIFGYGFYK